MAASVTKTKLLDALSYLLSRGADDPQAVYERVAYQYDQFRSLWIGFAGASMENLMFADLREILQPGQRVLDAGAGTGALSREIHALQPDVQLTMLDLSPAMLARTADIPGEHIEGSVLELPFPDNSFDLVVSGWVIETVPDPMQAVAEYLRVIQPAGYVLYTFCSIPHGWVSLAGTALLRAAVESRFSGHFLAPEETPWHDCERSRRVCSHAGLTTYIVLRKCCPIGPGIMPVPIADVPPTVVPERPRA